MALQPRVFVKYDGKGASKCAMRGLCGEASIRLLCKSTLSGALTDRALCAVFPRTQRNGGQSPPFRSDRGIQTVPVTVSVLIPGVTTTAPVAASRVSVAAGTVICPATVANVPVAVS